MRSSVFALVTIVFVGFLARTMPHASNFTPIIAMTLLAGIYAKQKWLAIVLPLSIMYLSDLVLNNTIYASYYEGFHLGFDPGVYFALLLCALLPAFAKTLPTAGLPRLFATGVGGSVLFFLVSNFATWIGSGMYPLDVNGLLACYTAAIPFFQNSLLGTLVFGAAGIMAMRYFTISHKEIELA